MQFSYSELEAYRQCRHKHQLAYHERWKPKELSAALSLGSHFHNVLEGHYQGILAKNEKGGTDVLRSCGATEEETALMTWMYQGYVEAYGSDPEWEIVKTEEWVEIDMGQGVKMVGKIDLQVKWQGDLWIVDHKTCKTLPKDLDLDLDDQLGLYIWAKRRDGVKIRGGIQSSIRKEKLVRAMTLQERYSRKMTFRTDEELDTMVAEARELMLEAEAGRGTERPRSPDPGRCGWKCDFTEACLHGRKYGQAKEKLFLQESNFKQETDEEKALRRKRMGA